MQEQQLFLEMIKGSIYENQFILLLNTGLRIGESIGLKWSDIDFESRTLRVERSATYRPGKGFVLDEPKSSSGKRLIPLTQEALNALYRQREIYKAIPIIPMEFHNFVFLNSNGKLNSAMQYNKWLNVHSPEYGLRTISPHILRHTFATRCIEGGMKPKCQQQLLGHSTLAMTMDMYVDITEEVSVDELKHVEKLLRIS